MPDDPVRPELGTIIVSGPQLADIFGITPERVQQLVKEGIVTRHERGRYDLLASVKRYVSFLRKGATANGTASGEGELDRERIRLTAAKADQEEIKAAILKGTVHDAKAVEAVWGDMIGAFRSRTLSIPTKAGPRARQADSDSAAVELLRELCFEALNELADYDPSKLTQSFVQADSEQSSPASELDNERVGGPDAETE